MGHLSFSVETFDTYRHGAHRLADFSRLQPAIRAAKLALNDSRVRIAVVKSRDGRMVYCADNRDREWPAQTSDIPLGEPAQSDSFDSSGTRMPTDSEDVDLRGYRRHMVALLILFAAAAWIDGSVML